LGNSTLFKGSLDNLLLFGRNKSVTPTAHEIGIAPEVSNQHGHELVILAGEHLLLEVGEAFGKPHRLAVGIVRTVFLLGASRGVEQSQIESLSGVLAEGQLTKTGIGLRAIVMQAEGISRRNVLINLFVHILQVLWFINNPSNAVLDRGSEFCHNKSTNKN